MNLLSKKKNSLKLEKDALLASISIENTYEEITAALKKIKLINVDLQQNDELDVAYQRVLVVFADKRSNNLKKMVELILREKYPLAQASSQLFTRALENINLRDFSARDIQGIIKDKECVTELINLLILKPNAESTPKDNWVYFLSEYWNINLKIIKEVAARRLGMSIEEARGLSLSYLEWKKKILSRAHELIISHRWQGPHFEILRLKDELANIDVLLDLYRMYLDYLAAATSIKSRLQAIFQNQYAVHVSRSMSMSIGIIKKGLRCTGGQHGANFLINSIPGGPQGAGTFIFRCADLFNESFRARGASISLSHEGQVVLKIKGGEVIEWSKAVDFQKIMARDYVQLNIETPVLSLHYLKSPCICVVDDVEKYKQELTRRKMVKKINGIESKGRFNHASDMTSFLIREGRSYLEKRLREVG